MTCLGLDGAGKQRLRSEDVGNEAQALPECDEGAEGVRKGSLGQVGHAAGGRRVCQPA